MDTFSETAPLRSSEDSEEQLRLLGSGCFCFNFKGLCFWRRESGDVGETAPRQGWWTQRAKKVREISEIVAGPKWKTLIRRLRFYGTNCNNKKMMMRRMNFRYDPQSYKLNFDEGFCRDGDDGFPDISSRFPPTPLYFDDNVTHYKQSTI